MREAERRSVCRHLHPRLVVSGKGNGREITATDVAGALLAVHLHLISETTTGIVNHADRPALAHHLPFIQIDDAAGHHGPPPLPRVRAVVSHRAHRPHLPDTAAQALWSPRHAQREAYPVPRLPIPDILATLEKSGTAGGPLHALPRVRLCGACVVLHGEGETIRGLLLLLRAMLAVVDLGLRPGLRALILPCRSAAGRAEVAAEAGIEHGTGATSFLKL